VCCDDWDVTQLPHTATHFNTLKHTAMHCNTLQHTATHCDMSDRSVMWRLCTGVTSHHITSQIDHTCHGVLQCVAVCCSALQCAELQHTVTRMIDAWLWRLRCDSIFTHCNTLQHTATHCNTLQRTTTHCHTLQRMDVMNHVFR